MFKKIWEGIKGFIQYISAEYEKSNPYEEAEKERIRKEFFDEY